MLMRLGSVDVAHIRYFRIAPSQFLYFGVPHIPVFSSSHRRHDRLPGNKRRPPSYYFPSSVPAAVVERYGESCKYMSWLFSEKTKRRWGRRINVRLEELAGMACLMGSHNSVHTLRLRSFLPRHPTGLRFPCRACLAVCYQTAARERRKE